MTAVSLLEFLKDRLDEDEQGARAAESGPWKATRISDCYSWEIVGPLNQVVYLGAESDGGVADDADAAFIAHHDPARVLREVDAKQRMIAVHRPYDPDPDQACLGCAGGIVWERCPVLRSLASVYATHTDYQESWQQ